MTKLPEDKITHNRITYVATPDPKKMTGSESCRRLCDLEDTPMCGNLTCGPRKIHWKKDKSNPTKYKIREGGFTLEEWLKAESCRDSHFINDFRLMMRRVDNNIFKVVNSVEELPRHFDSCSTMKKKFIEFGFVVEVKEEKFYSIGDRFMRNNEEVILAHVQPRKICLISLSDGNRIKDPIEVKSPLKITQSELDQTNSFYALISFKS